MCAFPGHIAGATCLIHLFDNYFFRLGLLSLGPGTMVSNSSLEVGPGLSSGGSRVAPQASAR